MTKRGFGLGRLWAGRAPRHADEHAAHEAHCTALCCGRHGQSMEVVSFTGTPEEACRLRDLGVREGVRVMVLRDGDPLMVQVADGRFGIGRAAAMNVLCRFAVGGGEPPRDPAGPRTLDTLRPGDEAVVAELLGDPAAMVRMMEMGLIPGTRVRVLKFAPLGDPIELLARGYHLTLRRAEAAAVLVE